MSAKFNAYLERQYDLRAQHPDHYKVKEQLQMFSDQVRMRLPVRQGIRCGAAEKAVFDLIPGQGQLNNQPALIFIHGGFWRSGDKRDCAFLAQSFHQQGVATILLNYSLAPAVSLTEIVKEVRGSVASIALQAPELGLDPERIVLGGHSAGGHLAAMVESTDWAEFGRAQSPVCASFGISGLYDPRPLSQTRFQQVLALSDDIHNLVATPSTSSMKGLDLVACGTEETDELKSQSKRYANAVNKFLELDPLFWIQDRDHYSVLLDLADVGTPLCRRVCSLLPH